ncbi:MAG: hypothetical protein SD837_10350 [Candidatus Electrothrix scaldis]|nr:MAG: hypothetical protein SD837_10350 [Candidatus Electrothrix sp. GW3-3]
MAIDPNSIVDYLKANKQAADFRSRQLLWATFDPREAYLGSAEQNTRLVEALKLGEQSPQAPQLYFIDQEINFGDSITATVISNSLISNSKVGIENSLTQTSTEVDSNQEIDLGRVQDDRLGIFPVHLKTNASTPILSSGLLSLLPANGKVAAQWFPVPIKRDDQRILLNVSEDSPGMEERVKKYFFSHLPEVAGDALENALIKMTAGDKLPGLFFDGAVGVGMISIAIWNPVVGGPLIVEYFVPMGISYLVEFTTIFFEEAIKLLPASWTDEEKETLRLLLVVPLSVLRFGISYRQFKKNKELCTTVTELNTLVNWIDSRENILPDSPIKTIGTIVSSTTNPIISLVCTAKKYKTIQPGS